MVVELQWRFDPPQSKCPINNSWWAGGTWHSYALPAEYDCVHLSGWQAEKSIAAQRQSSYGITYLRCDRASSCFIYIQQARRRERWNLSQTLDGLYVNYFSHHLVISKASITSSLTQIYSPYGWYLASIHYLTCFGKYTLEKAPAHHRTGARLFMLSLTLRSLNMHVFWTVWKWRNMQTHKASRSNRTWNLEVTVITTISTMSLQFYYLAFEA